MNTNRKDNQVFFLESLISGRIGDGILWFILLVLFLVMLVICFAPPYRRVTAAPLVQDSPCGQTLTQAAEESGYNNENEQITWAYDTGSECYVTYRYDEFGEGGGPEWAGGVSWIGYSAYFRIDYGSYFCGDTGQETTFHDLPACLTTQNEGKEQSFLWYAEDGDQSQVFQVGLLEGGRTLEDGEVLQLAEQLWQASGGFSPDYGSVSDDGMETDDISSDCTGLSPDDLRMGGVVTKKCQLRCVGIGGDPTEMSDEELWDCIQLNDGRSTPQDNGAIPVPDGNQDWPPAEEEFPGQDGQSGDYPDGGFDEGGADESAWKSFPAELVRNPFIPAAGAFMGTVISWLVTMLQTGIPSPVAPTVPTVKPIPTRPGGKIIYTMPENGLPETPSTAGQNPPDWDTWDSTVVEKPDVLRVEEQTGPGTDLSLLQPDPFLSRQKIIDLFGSDISAENLKRMDPAKVHLVDTDQFIQDYKTAFPKEFEGEQQKNLLKENFILHVGTDGFTNPTTGDVYIDKARQQNYGAPHEMLHLASNDNFHQYLSDIARENLIEQYREAKQPLPEQKVIDDHAATVATTIDEAATEFFTQIICQTDGVPRNSLYLLDGRTDVIQDLVIRVGTPAVRNAYFGKGTEGIENLQREVDRRIGRGGFKKFVDLMAHRQYGLARTLLNPEQPFTPPNPH